MLIDFTLRERPPGKRITDAEWWLWEKLSELEPGSQLSGIYANKKGFHNTGNANEQNWPGNYSIRDTPNRRGPWWREYASALDWTFPDAQAGDYRAIAKYSNRLLNSGRDKDDPRLDDILFEFFGQCDNDKEVEGWNEYREENASSDDSHLWHIHMSFMRDKCGDFWSMWALYTVLIGWTVQQWRQSLTGGTSMLCRHGDKGPIVEALQRLLLVIDPSCLPNFGADQVYGDEVATALKAKVGFGDGKYYGPSEYASLMVLVANKHGGGAATLPATVNVTGTLAINR